MYGKLIAAAFTLGTNGPKLRENNANAILLFQNLVDYN